MNDNLYPEIEPFNSGLLPVDTQHTLYYEECGHPEGIPVLFVHGGPGSGSAPIWRRYFNPQKYRIILFDQRGCGKSTPYACLDNNTTLDLIQDIEKLRKHFKIDRWLLVGGSWGSTLCLAYSQENPDKVSGLIMYGLFLGTPREIEWFYQTGASYILPDAWDDFSSLVTDEDKCSMVKAYYRLLNSGDVKVQAQAAHHWSLWEARGLRLIPDLEQIEQFVEPEKALAQARIECHFMANNCFLSANQLTKGTKSIKGIRSVIIHGRYDLICPVTTSWTIKKEWPEVELIIVPDAGHSAREPGIQHELISALNRF